jgi:formate dehydrogenase accessory protein FdhD
VHILRSSAGSQTPKEDRVAVEAPLEFLLHHPSLGPEPLSFGTTMRTPGDDESLAAGLLYGEGIVSKAADIEALESSTRRPNVINVRLHPSVQIVPNTPSRLFSAGSSCGVCGTTGLDAAIARAAATHIPDTGHAAMSLLMQLPDRMRAAQSKFGYTGGVHASALFDFSGNLLNLAEDVGRHNAFDKLVGMSLMSGDLPLTNRIVVLSESMRERIASKIGGTRASRIDVIHNWADGSDIRPLGEDSNPFVVDNSLGESFVVLFSGNMGRVNEFSTVMDAALLLRERSDIIFLFVGDGAKADEIREFQRKHNLTSLRLLPYQPRHQLRYSLAAGDVLLVTLAEGLAGLSVPSKAYAIMAAGRPLLFVGDPKSDIARIITRYKCGAVFASGDCAGLAELISEWSADSSKLKEMGAAARSLFEERFDRSHAVSAYLDTLNKCVRPLAELSEPAAVGSGD